MAGIRAADLAPNSGRYTNDETADCRRGKEAPQGNTTLRNEQVLRIEIAPGVGGGVRYTRDGAGRGRERHARASVANALSEFPADTTPTSPRAAAGSWPARPRCPPPSARPRRPR